MALSDAKRYHVLGQLHMTSTERELSGNVCSLTSSQRAPGVPPVQVYEVFGIHSTVMVFSGEPSSKGMVDPVRCADMID
ncbi:hypothetical protein M378DRAFT_379656 [Amanita muscaria Koide BX008]|uniref:Uncharacterized protein n=1 Tax=Amanita muscaria (strain Koide BX008) TaxID=946122 RepID=A0A0C2WLI9_AMAMK|nr:hypothetical protein M378DRAFT_379656 [Amanita muscaria Koide BX008]